LKEKHNLDEYLKTHFIHRSNWLRAAVLGANDGILSTASIAIGVAAATPIAKLAVDKIPSFAPNTAALNQLLL